MTWQRLGQIGFIAGAWMVGTAVVRATGAPVSGGLVGLALTLLLLATGRLPLGAIKQGADWLLADMSLFFVPALLAVVDHRELLGWLGLKVLLVIFGSTLAVMVVTGLLVELTLRRPVQR